MDIVLGSDHAGYQIKEAVKSFLEANKADLNINEVIDLGCHSEESVHYPEYGKKVAHKVAEDFSKYKGILVCGSGIGISIAANKVPGIRAALCTNAELAKLSRQHNDANVLALAGRFTSEEDAFKIVKTWLQTEFEGGRHQLRVDLIEE